MPEPASDTRPTVRLLHHLARTGGTVISKCVAVMPKVALLSEIHPLGARKYNPLSQAREWYGLLTPEDSSALRAEKRVRFDEVIDLIRRRCEERGLKLVLRDWNHMDFHGVPFTTRLPGRMLSVEALAPRFRLVRFCTVRHPIDHWKSMEYLAEKSPGFTPEVFLQGCMAFAEEAAKVGFVRYEDLAAEPHPAMKTICDRLEIPFDPAFIRRWSSYTKMTGDTNGTRGGLEQIKKLTRRPVTPELIERFATNPAYRRTLELLGYGHPE